MYGLNVPHLQDSYVSLAGDALMDRLNDGGELGKITSKLIQAYYERSGTSHIMSSKSCILAQLRAMTQAGLQIVGYLGNEPWSTNDLNGKID
jgi:hypothetical protein